MLIQLKILVVAAPASPTGAAALRARVGTVRASLVGNRGVRSGLWHFVEVMLDLRYVSHVVDHSDSVILMLLKCCD